MPYWKSLSSKQFGTYVEYLARLEFARLGADIYLPEIDDKGIDFIVRTSEGKYFEIQVKGRRQLNYFYVEKGKLKNSLLFLGLFTENKIEGDFYLIPVNAWQTPNSLFRDYPYGEGKKSPPEWGLDFKSGNMGLLEPYRFQETYKRLISRSS